MTRDHTRTTGALRREFQRWFAPSRPLAVDDEPNWQPAADPAGESSRRDSEVELPASPAP